MLPRIAVALAAVAVLALLWIAGEQHYQSCVAKVSARTQPWSFSAPAPKRSANGFLVQQDGGGWSTLNLDRAQAELAKCSRF